MTINRIATFVAALAAVPGAQALAAPNRSVDPHVADGTATKQLKAAETRWARHNIDSYSIRISRQCFCLPASATIDVRGGRIVHKPKDWTGPSTVPQLFRFVRKAVAERPAQLTVRYARARGYPLSVFVDRSKMIADEEIGYTAKVIESAGRETPPMGLSAPRARAHGRLFPGSCAAEPSRWLASRCGSHSVRSWLW
jgi:hypothetical protein